MKNTSELNKESGSRLKKAIKARKMHQIEFAQKVNFTPQYISEICQGKKKIGANAYDFAKALDIRPEYLLCIDDYMTDEDILKEKKDAFFRSIGNMAVNGEKTIANLERLERVSKLHELSKPLEELYGIPVNWDDLPLGESLNFYSFIDEQLEHAFKTYFKYIAPSSDTDKEDVSTALDGLGIILDESVSAIKQLYPEGITEEQFIQSLESEEKVNEIENALKKLFIKEET